MSSDFTEVIRFSSTAGGIAPASLLTSTCQFRLGVSVDLGVHDIGVRLRRSVVNRREGLTGPPVCGPKANQHNGIIYDG
jgi:hypothetical protein